jgi:hypothetical protein
VGVLLSVLLFLQPMNIANTNSGAMTKMELDFILVLFSCGFLYLLMFVAIFQEAPDTPNSRTLTTIPGKAVNVDDPL